MTGRILTCLVCALAFGAAWPALSHDSKATGASGATQTADTDTITVVVRPEEEAPDPPVVGVRLGEHVHLKVVGAGGHDMHLHGIDPVFEPQPDGSVLASFEASATGRFRLEMHGEDPLLGPRDRALLYLEVRSK